MKVALLVGGDFHTHFRVSLAVLSLRKTEVYSEKSTSNYALLTTFAGSKRP